MSMKLKPSGATAFWSTIVIILILVGVRLYFEEAGFRLAIGALMTVMCLMHLVIIVRIRNAVYTIPFLFYLFGALTFLTNDTRIENLVPYFAAAAGVAYLMLLWALFTKRMKWRYREILELAARPVEGAEEGFTQRPYPAGEAACSREELAGYASYLLKHMIAFPYLERDRLVLVVPENMLPRLLGLKRAYDDSTFVSFGLDGKISVQIAKRDYGRYREELTFDELCRSFAALFGEFLELHRGGRGELIVRRLDGLERKAREE
jgi:hypothetical protein